MAAFRALNQVRRVFAELYETSEQAMSWAVSRVWPAKDLVVGMDNVFWSSAQDTGADSNQEWLHEPWQWKKQGVSAPFFARLEGIWWISRRFQSLRRS